MNSFATLGFLSADVEGERDAIREKHQLEFARVEDAAVRALAEVAAVSGDASREYLAAVAYWLRCIECCQAAVLLVERGLPTAPFAIMRGAFECLFFACALWRKPALAAQLQVQHDIERVRQAKEMIKAGAASRVAPDRFIDLEMIAGQPVPGGAGLSAWQAANDAGLTYEYENAYRGFSIAGAHASLRSLDSYFVEQSDGSITLAFEPSSERAAWLLGLVVSCLKCGIDRHRQARTQVSPSPDPAAQ